MILAGPAKKQSINSEICIYFALSSGMWQSGANQCYALSIKVLNLYLSHFFAKPLIRTWT